MNSNELTQQIEEASGLTIAELPRVTGLSWFGGVDAQGRPTAPVAVVLGQPFPLKNGAVPYAMFQDNEVVRVYTLSKDQKNPSPPSRYTFTKNAPTFVSEDMSLETFIDEIAEEWQIVAGLDELDEIEEAPESSAAAPVSASSPSTATLTP